MLTKCLIPHHHLQGIHYRMISTPKVSPNLRSFQIQHLHMEMPILLTLVLNTFLINPNSCQVTLSSPRDHCHNIKIITLEFQTQANQYKHSTILLISTSPSYHLKIGIQTLAANLGSLNPCSSSNNNIHLLSAKKVCTATPQGLREHL